MFTCRILLIAGIVLVGFLSVGGSHAAAKKSKAPAAVAAKPARPTAPKKIVLIAGKGSHGTGAHAHTEGIKLLKGCLDTATNVKGFTTTAVYGGWRKDQSVLDGAATIVVFSDGFAGHPLKGPEKMKKVGELMARGTGLIMLHYAVAPVPDKVHTKAFLEWTGGYYEKDYSKNPHNDTTVSPGGKHPICRGWSAYEARDEFYYQIRFGENDKLVSPIATVMLPKNAPKKETIAWAVQRQDGGRGFGFTGAHFHKNWKTKSADTSFCSFFCLFFFALPIHVIRVIRGQIRFRSPSKYRRAVLAGVCLRGRLS